MGRRNCGEAADRPRRGLELMSDEHVLDRIEISQGGRWYRWHTREMPLQRREIQYNSANIHMIQKDEVIADLLDEVQLGHIVHLWGYLVETRAPDGCYWPRL
ncbi:MAG: hypothetical protein AB2697_02570 [Candidatus Thiodiazotropha endolucinida]